MAAPVLVADIGGTNSRFALHEGSSTDLSELRKYPNREFSGFTPCRGGELC